MTSANGFPTIKTFSGYTLDYLKPRPFMICPEDIAHGLSQTCRFAGQSKLYFSVAQHSVLVSKLVRPSLARAGLFHDGSEAYMGDLAAPLKRLLPDYKKIEEGLLQVIFERFDIPWPMSSEIKQADLEARALEGREFMDGRADEYGVIRGEPPQDIAQIVTSLNPLGGEVEFLKRYRELF